MKKTIHVYSFFEKTKGLKLTMTLCAFAFCLFVSSNAFSQIQAVDVSSLAQEDNQPAETLDFLQGLDYSNFDPVQGQLKLDAELDRLNNSIIIPGDEVSIKTSLIGFLDLLLDQPQTGTPDLAITAAYPKLVRFVADENIARTSEEVDEMVLDIARILE